MAKPRKGQIVAVRSESEIRATLDPSGTLGGLPFMPEMRKYCGRAFRVFRRAEKTCVEGCRIRRMEDTVFLDGVRCDGAFHAGCQRRCLIFWKEAWLKPVGHAASDDPPDADRQVSGSEPPTAEGGKFRCQSTELHKATTPLPWWDVRQYVRDLALGEATLFELAWQLWLLARNRVRRVFAGSAVQGTAPRQASGADHALDLQLGELVEIRSEAEVRASLNLDGKNRGLEFTPDMVPYCGARHRVAGRVERIILECTGEMRQVRDTVILEDLVCNGAHARGCPRANYYYWREAWLKRVSASSAS